MTNKKQLTLGGIYHHRKFEYKNGETGVKFLVLLNEPSSSFDDYLFIRTTTQQHRRAKTHGCQPDDKLFFIPSDSDDEFTRSVWLQFEDIYVFESSSVLQDHFNGDLKFKGMLSELTIRQVINCLKKIKDYIATKHLNSILETHKNSLS